jgi:hypothetical protein
MMSVSSDRDAITSRNVDDALRNAQIRAARYPFTIATLGLIAFAGFLTRTTIGQTITRGMLGGFGSSPRDLLSLDLVRVATSAFVTDGGWVFVLALACTALFVGAAEHYTGTLATLLTFWGAHFATFALMLLLTLSLSAAGSRLALLLYATRDVGPSAGYVGCLGLALVTSGRAWRWWAIGFVAAALGATLVLALPELRSQPREVSAALAHLTALAVGVAIGVIRDLRSREASR